MLNLEEYMTMTEAHKALGLTRQGLWKQVKRGKAPKHVQVAGRTLFERADVMVRVKNNPAEGGGR